MPRRPRPYDPAARTHDRSGFYSRTDRVTFDEIPDPYVHVSEREPVKSPQGGEWVVPAAPTLVVARSRAELLAGLHSRRQIGDAEFQAGRFYQRLAETAGRSVKSGSLEPRVQGGLIADVPDEVLIADAEAAAHRRQARARVWHACCAKSTRTYSGWRIFLI